MDDTDVTVQLSVPKEGFASFLACLGIGTLQAMREGILPLEVGIWGLAAPLVFVPQPVKDLLPQEILGVFRECDELSLMAELLPDKIDKTLEELIIRLQAELKEIEEPVWRFYLEIAPVRFEEPYSGEP